MLEEIRTRYKFGIREDLWRVYDLIGSHKKISFIDLKRLTSRNLSRDSDFENIFFLFTMLKIIESESGLDYKLTKPIMKKEVLFSQLNSLLLGEIEISNRYEVEIRSKVKYSINNGQFYIKFNEFPIKYSSLRDLFIQTKLFIQVEDNLFIDSDYRKFFSTNKKQTLVELMRIKELQMEQGRLAEEFVLKYEHERLFNHPFRTKIERISDVDTRAGYDIISFKDNSSIYLDMYIEVKSYSSKEHFYWSKNEIEVAKNHISKYVIYLVDMNKILEEGYEPDVIYNPYEYLFDNKNTDWHITMESINVRKV
ncbi:MAG: hypothetical protein CVV00_02925 [Firmicutes bacterium HGW-Firmicutes-5]|nr:MAG: hypothetical protein CVV00_02925 [Firmicutes bacterium HGW-Firmicutes-5]